MRRTAWTAADGVGATEWLEIGGEKKPLVMSDLIAARTATDGKWVGRMAWTAADGVGTRELLEMGGEKKTLVMSDLGCADGCGRETGAENCADGCGRRGCNGVAGNSWGEKKPLGMSKLNWLRRRLRTGNARTIADSVGVTEWVEMGGEKQPLVMSDLGCAEGCGRAMGAEKCTDGCGQRGCKGVAGNGWGGEAVDDERAWLRGRLRTANGLGELRRRLRTAWVPGCGWKWVGRRSRWRSASLAVRTAADGKWMRRIARTAPDGVGATEWLEMGGEKRPLVMCELSCARLRTGNGCGELRGRLRTAWVRGSGWKWVGRRRRWR